MNGSTLTLNYAWGYDADQRLTGESLTATSSSSADTTTVAAMDYSDMYTFDLDGNRLTEVTTGTGDGTAGTTNYAYNGDDQLTSSTSTATGVTTLTYDLNGSQLTSTTGGVTTTYTYDVRNKMIGYHSGTTTATYVVSAPRITGAMDFAAEDAEIGRQVYGSDRLQKRVRTTNHSFKPLN